MINVIRRSQVIGLMTIDGSTATKRLASALAQRVKGH
jgi:hypothetical protein